MTQASSPSDAVIPAGHAALVALLATIGVGNLLAIHFWLGPGLTQHPTAVVQDCTHIAPLPHVSTTPSASAPLAASAGASTFAAPDAELVPALHFERDEHTLHSGHVLLLARAVEQLRGHPRQQVVVRACTDGTGPADWNELLRGKRALAVVHELRSHGIERDRIVMERCAPGFEGLRDDDPRRRRVELRTR